MLYIYCSSNSSMWKTDDERIATLSFVYLDKNKNKSWDRREWKNFRDLVTSARWAITPHPILNGLWTLFYSIATCADAARRCRATATSMVTKRSRWPSGSIACKQLRGKVPPRPSRHSQVGSPFLKSLSLMLIQDTFQMRPPVQSFKVWIRWSDIWKINRDKRFYSRAAASTTH